MQIDDDPSAVTASFFNRDTYSAGREGVSGVFTPLRGDDTAAIQVIVPADLKKLVLAFDSVQVKMEKRYISRILIDDGEGRACHAGLDPQSGSKASHERRFTRSQVTVQSDAAASAQFTGERAPQFKCFRFAVCNNRHESPYSIVIHTV